MSSSSAQFPYTMRDPVAGSSSLTPMLPLVLSHQASIAASGLLDSGAMVNVLPFYLGIQLGYKWEEQTSFVRLSGNLAQSETRVVALQAQIADFAPVRLVFAWTQSDSVPVILGQVNFFQEFDVCFFRSREVFEVQPK